MAARRCETDLQPQRAIVSGNTTKSRSSGLTYRIPRASRSLLAQINLALARRTARTGAGGRALCSSLWVRCRILMWGEVSGGGREGKIAGRPKRYDGRGVRMEAQGRGSDSPEPSSRLGRRECDESIKRWFSHSRKRTKARAIIASPAVS